MVASVLLATRRVYVYKMRGRGNREREASQSSDLAGHSLDVLGWAEQSPTALAMARAQPKLGM